MLQKRLLLLVLPVTVLDHAVVDRLLVVLVSSDYAPDDDVVVLPFSLSTPLNRHSHFPEPK